MLTFLKVLVCELVGLLAPFVTLFYRGGWFNTPDDPGSPHGLYEPTMRHILARFGRYWSDWWWLGVRNRAYGLRYALKPDEFKGLRYDQLNVFRGQIGRKRKGRLRITRVLTRKEYALDCRWFHIIYGYRVTPIFNEVMRNLTGPILGEWWDVPHRPVNMDARPIFSIRSGAPD